jgi:hypothetical protein
MVGGLFQFQPLGPLGCRECRTGCDGADSRSPSPGACRAWRETGLPDLPPLFISLYGKNDPAETPVVDRLRALLQESLETCLGAAM